MRRPITVNCGEELINNVEHSIKELSKEAAAKEDELEFKRK
jgi:hypothetical protein